MGGVASSLGACCRRRQVGLAVAWLTVGLWAARPAAGQVPPYSDAWNSAPSSMYGGAPDMSVYTPSERHHAAGLQPEIGPSLRFAQAPGGGVQNPSTLPANPPQEIAPRVQLPGPRGGLGASPARSLLIPGVPPAFADPPECPEPDSTRLIQRTIDAECTLDLVVGRTRIVEFNRPPSRIYIAHNSTATYQIISEREVALVGLAPGRTELVLWMDEPNHGGNPRVSSYLLRVWEDADYRLRREAVYQVLEEQINRNFPDSLVKLSLIGDQVVVRGQAKDVIEARQIIQIVELNAPNVQSSQSIRAGRSQYGPLGPEFESVETNADLYQDLTAGEGINPNVINQLTIPGEQQVMLRVTVAEVNRSALRSIGANMSIGEGNSGDFSSAFPFGNLLEEINTGILMLEGGTFSLMRGDLRLTVNALKQHNLARTLAEPNLVTLHGRRAQFQAGGQFPVPSARVGFGSAAQGVEFIPFGVQLTFVPYIIDRDKIRLIVAANVSTRDDALATEVSGSNVPGLNTRNFQNTVELREGQTLAVAGLIQSNFGANSSRVPGVGDLPIIGRLFKSDGTSADEQELVILITPELVHPVDPEAPLSLPGSDVFEPSDVEFYIKGQLESRRSEDFRSPVRTDWARLKRYHECEDLFIIGPSGHSYGCRDHAMPSGHLRSSAGASSWPAPEMLPGAVEATPSQQ